MGPQPKTRTKSPITFRSDAAQLNTIAIFTRPEALRIPLVIIIKYVGIRTREKILIKFSAIPLIESGIPESSIISSAYRHETTVIRPETTIPMVMELAEI